MNVAAVVFDVGVGEGAEIGSLGRGLAVLVRFMTTPMCGEDVDAGRAESPRARRGGLRSGTGAKEGAGDVGTSLRQGPGSRVYAHAENPFPLRLRESFALRNSLPPGGGCQSPLPLASSRQALRVLPACAADVCNRAGDNPAPAR
ncbi:hypothetical protein GCM10027430_24040 [Lysobacter tyrosinilyticus]